MKEYTHNDWRGSTGGMPWMQRALVKLFRFIPLWFCYGVMSLVIPFYMLFDRRGYRASYRFFRRRVGRSAVGSFFSVYANEFRMGQVVLDRFAFYAGRRFDLQIEGMDRYLAMADAEPGFIQVSSHVGNYELAGYSLRAEKKRIHALVFSGETATVMQQRAEMFHSSNIAMVPVATDMSHLFVLNAALVDGEVVSMPGDRIHGSSKSIACLFMGAPAKFPAGPFMLAAQREVAMLAVFVMKEGLRRYRVFVRPLEVASDPEAPSRKRAEALAACFAGELEAVVRRYPTQWFNFYDFWQ